MCLFKIEKIYGSERFNKNITILTRHCDRKIKKEKILTTKLLQEIKFINLLFYKLNYCNEDIYFKKTLVEIRDYIEELKKNFYKNRLGLFDKYFNLYLTSIEQLSLDPKLIEKFKIELISEENLKEDFKVEIKNFKEIVNLKFQGKIEKKIEFFNKEIAGIDLFKEEGHKEVLNLNYKSLWLDFFKLKFENNNNEIKCQLHDIEKRIEKLPKYLRNENIDGFLKLIKIEEYNKYSHIFSITRFKELGF